MKTLVFVALCVPSVALADCNQVDRFKIIQGDIKTFKIDTCFGKTWVYVQGEGGSFAHWIQILDYPIPANSEPPELAADGKTPEFIKYMRGEKKK
jgi:hypothetical protein